MEREKLIALVTAAQRSDQEALNELFNAFYNDVYYFALKTVKDEELACDVTQETFVEIINTLDKLEEPAAFVKWMKQITYHQCTRYFKKKKDVLVDEDEEGNTVFDTLKEEKAEFIPEEALDQAEFKKTIMDMIDELSPEQRAALMMFHFDELSLKEIAQIQGVSENTVKSRLNYARKGIKKSVEDYEKKNGVKLHSVAILPLLLWLFKDYFAQSVPATATAVAEGVAAATGATVTVSAAASATTTAAAATGATAATVAGVGAKVGIPLATKIVAGALAATLAVGGGTAAVILSQPEETAYVQEVEPSSTQVDGYGGPTPEEEGQFHMGTIPEGMVYTLYDGTVLEAGEDFPASCTPGDTVLYGDYYYGFECLYTYNLTDSGVAWMSCSEISTPGDSGVTREDILDCWLPIVKDQTKTQYGPIQRTINGKPVGALWMTFQGCKNMTVAPEIPNGVTSISVAFYDCVSLQTAPVIPPSVERLMSTFQNCTSLRGDVEIHANLDTSRFWNYHATFANTAHPINLMGSTPEEQLLLIADEDTNRQITVNGKYVDYTRRDVLNVAEKLLAVIQSSTGYFSSVEELIGREREGIRDAAYYALFMEGAYETVEDNGYKYVFDAVDLEVFCREAFHDNYNWQQLSSEQEYFHKATNTVRVYGVPVGNGTVYRTTGYQDNGNGTYGVTFDVLNKNNDHTGSGLLTLGWNEDMQTYYAISCLAK